LLALGFLSYWNPVFQYSHRCCRKTICTINYTLSVLGYSILGGAVVVVAGAVVMRATGFMEMLHHHIVTVPYNGWVLIISGSGVAVVHPE